MWWASSIFCGITLGCLWSSLLVTGSIVHRLAEALAVPENELQFCNNMTFDETMASNENELVFAQYNVWNFDDGPDWATKRSSAVFAILLKENPDVIGLNELRISLSGGSMFKDACEALIGYSGIFQPAMKYSDGTVEGIALFSRLSVSHIKARHLHFINDNVADPNRRAIIGAKVRRGSLSIEVFVSHFSYDETQRYGNALSAGLFILSFGERQAQRVFMADFNAVSEHDSTVLFIERVTGMEDVMFASGKQTYCNCGHENCELDKRPDRILVSSGTFDNLTAWVGPSGTTKRDVCPSDHRAIYLRAIYLRASTNL